MCLSGVVQIAALWLRELTGTALADGLWGTVYVIIGIGLYGRSRFSLFMAMVIPAAATSVLFYTAAQPEQVYALRIAVDVVVVLLSAVVLWETRHHPGM
jgi:ABC-type transport system involved in cytochrome c biogenesis permease subunit